MKYVKITSLISLIIFIQIALVIQFGTNAYIRGVKDGEMIGKREMAAMIYLKPKMIEGSKMGIDAWDLVEDAKNKPIDTLETGNMYLSKIRTVAIISAHGNYTAAFSNGISPKDVFRIK